MFEHCAIWQSTVRPWGKEVWRLRRHDPTGFLAFRLRMILIMECKNPLYITGKRKAGTHRFCFGGLQIQIHLAAPLCRMI